MRREMSVTFLGTCSGGGPTETRNCSSLMFEHVSDGPLWMVDCAEGTLRQIALQTNNRRLKLSKLTKIFVTHMHADHIMGIPTLLRNVLLPPRGADLPPPTCPPKIQIYGPAGLRNFVRLTLSATFTKTAERYVVHELLTPGDKVTPCTADVLQYSEAPGLDILSDCDTLWREFVKEDSGFGTMIADAGPIAHRDPCLGFVFREGSAPFRKLGLLGDTHDPLSMSPILSHPPPTLLIHEATDAYIPQSIDSKARRAPHVVDDTCKLRGHSTPSMAGDFAKKVGAHMLVLNHIGARFPAPWPNGRGGTFGIRTKVIEEIGRQASEAWGLGEAIVAYDFLRVPVPVPETQEAKPQTPAVGAAEDVTSSPTILVDGSGSSFSSEQTIPNAGPKRGQTTQSAGRQGNQIGNLHDRPARGEHRGGGRSSPASSWDRPHHNRDTYPSSWDRPRDDMDDRDASQYKRKRDYY